MFDQENPLNYKEKVRESFLINSDQLGKLITEFSVGRQEVKRRRATLITNALLRVCRKKNIELKKVNSEQEDYKPYLLDAKTTGTILGWNTESTKLEGGSGLGASTLNDLQQSLIHAVKIHNSSNVNENRVTDGIFE